jgi:hypothetical protein
MPNKAEQSVSVSSTSEIEEMQSFSLSLSLSLFLFYSTICLAYVLLNHHMRLKKNSTIRVQMNRDWLENNKTRIELLFLVNDFFSLIFRFRDYIKA